MKKAFKYGMILSIFLVIVLKLAPVLPFPAQLNIAERLIGYKEAVLEFEKYILEDDLFAGIIPAFEVTKPSCDSISDCVIKVAPLLPADKSSLIQCIKNQTCFLYREMRSTHVNNHLVVYLIRITCMRNGFILIVLIIIH